MILKMIAFDIEGKLYEVTFVAHDGLDAPVRTLSVKPLLTAKKEKPADEDKRTEESQKVGGA